MTRITAQNDLYHNGIFERKSRKSKMRNALFYAINYQFRKVHNAFFLPKSLIFSFLAKKKTAQAVKVHINIIQKQ
jgi:hypothetical protein